MKTWNSILLFFFLTFLASKITAQNSFFNINNIHLEISPFLGELKIENNPFREFASLGFGGEMGLGISTKKKWSFNVGVNFFSQEFSNSIPFEVIYSNPNNAASSMNDFFIENLTNSFSTYNIEFTLKFDGTDCFDFNRPDLDGVILNLDYNSVNRLQQIGIPFKIEKKIGRKPLKFYLGIGVVPTFVISNPQLLIKYKNSQIFLNDYQHRCHVRNIGLQQLMVTQQNPIFQKQNIINTRLDFRSEFGLLHEGPKNTFKIALFFGESLTGFTEVDGVQYQARMTRIKFSLSKNIYKSKS